MSDHEQEKVTEPAAGFASPASACSAPEYKIEHVRDLLAVPEDRLDACLEELKDYLALAREMQELTKVVGEIVGADGSSTIGAFTWIDDGKHERTVRIQTKIEGPNPADESRRKGAT